VARKFLENVEMEPKVKSSCVSLLQFFHASTSKWSEDFYKKLRRKYYVTPTSYIEMIALFQQLLDFNR
jgi:dynein heavy chain